MLRLSIFFVILLSPFCGVSAGEGKPTVLVSLAPYQYFVERIAGDTVNVRVMVPAGANAHAYEPTPRQMIEASRAIAWFRLGESFEQRAVPVLLSSNRNLRLYDLRDNIDLMSGTCSCCHADAADLHLWLSPRVAKVQAETIARGLSEVLPEHADQYQKNLKQLVTDLDALDDDIRTTLQHPKHRTILVAHPSYAYFCRDYGLEQLSVECEGKDPTPRQLTSTIEKARRLQLNTVFVQRQFSTKGATIVANQLGAKLVEVDPYSPDYMTMMRDLAKHFAED